MDNNESAEQPLAPPSWKIETWFPELDPGMRKQLKAFHEELLKMNRSINLISPKTTQFADAIHFSDSILATRVIFQDDPKMTEIYDLGSGAGFPGLVMAVLLPKLKVHLIESDAKKCEFLNHIIKLLGLKNANVINKTVESLEANSIQTCMARGLSSISKSILVARKCVKKGGVFYHLKAETWPAEVGEIPTQLCSVWAPALVGEYKMPIGGIKFAVVKTDKIA